MAWYYMKGEERLGPLDEAEFQKLRSNGDVTEETFVWQDGMPDWVPYKDAARRLSSQGGACTECGKVLPEAELLKFGEARVCLDCKPKFLAKLKEGVTLQGHFDQAGFGLRLGAYVLDVLILTAVNVPISLLGTLAVASLQGEGAVGEAVAIGGQLLVTLVTSLLNLGYEIFMTGKYGYTLGKKIVGIKVVRTDGSRVGWGRSTGRYFAKIISGCALLIGYLMVLWDPNKQSLHDKMVDTYVVRM